MPLTALPNPPSRDDPANFAARADAWNAALQLFSQQLNALSLGESASGLAISLADKTSIGLGDQMLGVGAVAVIVAGQLTRWASINDAVSALGTTRCQLLVRSDTTLLADVTIPSTMGLAILNAAQIALAGHTLTINGRMLDAGLHTCFSGSGTVVFSPGSADYVRPEWWGAKADAVVNGSGGTDSTAAIQAAANAAPPIVFTGGNYLFSNLTTPSNKAWYGQGLHISNLIAKVGSTGTMFTDQGDAAKIDMIGIAFYGNNCAYTAGFKLGYGGGSQFGTEGYLDGIWVRDLPAGFPGIDIRGNVGHIGGVWAQDTGGLRIVGSANMVNQAQSYGAKGFTEAGVTVGCSIQTTAIGAIEIEAPANGVVPMYLLGNATIGNLTISLASGNTHSHLVEVGASATTWNFTLNLVFNPAGAAPVITNGNIKIGSRYLGGNASGRSALGEGFYTAENFGQRLQSFMLKVVNTGGTLQHQITSVSGGVTSSASAISGASSTLSNTPTGTDSSTAMAAGGKLGSSAPSVFYLDTVAQSDAALQMFVGPVLTNCGQALVAVLLVSSININGTTRARLAVQFLNASSAGVYSLASLTAGQYVQVQLHGYMAT